MLMRESSREALPEAVLLCVSDTRRIKCWRRHKHARPDTPWRMHVAGIKAIVHALRPSHPVIFITIIVNDAIFATIAIAIRSRIIIIVSIIIIIIVIFFVVQEILEGH